MLGGCTGIVNGYDGKFDPNEFITREQIATILFRYARYKRETTTGVVDKLDSFLDKEKISDYAYEALAWANHNGIILGKPSEGGNIIDPLANATRAEVSTMMIRYVDKYND